ncbi:tRNA-binding protein [bacterium]|nr:MAG: tRNA-binding protein [bacterium]
MRTVARTEPSIEYRDFSRVDMRVGRIVKVEDFPNAKNPSYKIWVDFGELGVKKSSAQLTKYSKDRLMSTLVIAVVNFRPKQIADFMSEVLILGVSDESGFGVVAIQPEREVPLGRRVY